MFNWHTLTDTETLEEHFREMGRRFSTCFLILETANGNKYPVTYRRNTENGHEFSSRKYGTILVNIETEVSVHPIFPDVGLYRIDGNLHYFHKRPARQWKRGVCSSNARLFDLEANREVPIIEDYYHLMCYQPIGKYSYSASRLLRDSVVFDRQWGVSKTGELFFCDTSVGRLSMDADSGQVTMAVNELLHQEAVDRFGKEFDKWQIQSIPAQ